MPRLSQKVVEHRLQIDPAVRPVQQRKCHLGSKRQAVMKDEVSKLLKIGFVKKIKCSKWIANTMLVKKSNGSQRMCVDYASLNKTCPKDPFPLSNWFPRGPHCKILCARFYGCILKIQSDKNVPHRWAQDYFRDRSKTILLQGDVVWVEKRGSLYQRMVNKIFYE
jgi:hypothetical protein